MKMNQLIREVRLVDRRRSL